MLQALLIERFQIVPHRDQKTVRVFALSIGDRSVVIFARPHG
jgi:uncharacterized protein (TIGR03435 family)